ncbi:hypothetical protein Clacol_003720 [Clathrus columnatus]|uniref:Co-chaperone HscB C-terminal oligomerisation domain-containing protein n=1 Tax=Clathrus columnatus TaxID=1419009 RepID=A0AAV5A4H7_9AGAM|nr:hypothetical protein Clacol_003720 [Clathrus columnatus]
MSSRHMVTERRTFSIAAAQSSQLNKAYQTLLSPLLRAEYILAKQGIYEDENEKLEDPEFITEIMDIRQEIEDASDDETLTRLSKKNKEKIDLTIGQVSQLIQDRNWKAAKTASTRLKYLLGIDKAAEKKIHHY